MSESTQLYDNQFGWFLLAAWAMGGVLVVFLVVGEEGWAAFTPFLLVRVFLGGVFFIPATAVLVFLILAMSRGGGNKPTVATIIALQRCFQRARHLHFEVSQLKAYAARVGLLIELADFW